MTTASQRRPRHAGTESPCHEDASGPTTVLIAGLTALVLGLVLQPIAIRFLRRRGVLDHPSHRSSHAVPTVRGGGVALVTALLLGGVAGGATQDGPTSLVLLAVALCGLVGLAEDVRGIPVLPRFALLAVATAPLALLPGADRTAWVLLGLCAIIFAVAVVNAVNFMDGINGISAVQGLVAGSAYALLAATQGLPLLAAVAVATAAAALSFAPFNVPRARVFLGDTGSYGLGGALGGMAALLILAGLPLEAALAPLALYLADTGTTLLRRFRAGEAWHLPHRTHVYQRLTDQGLSHVQVSAIVMLLLVICSSLGGLALEGGALRIVGDLVLVSVLAAYLSLPRLLARRRSLA